MSQLHESSLAIRRTSAVHRSPVAASVRWYSAVGSLIVLALLAIAALAVRDSQSGQLGPGGAAPGAQALPPRLGSQAASLPFAQTPSTALPAGAKRRAADAYAKLPLAFTPNAGQTDHSVRYYAQGAGYTFYFTDHKAVLALQKGHHGQALDLRFVGANPNAKLEAADRGTARVNYLTGSEHHTNLPTYGQLIYRDLWPGIDMVFGGKGGKLNYEFRLRPGAKVSDISLAYAGAQGVSLGAGGALRIHTPLGTLNDARPQTFQRIDGRRVPVDSSYALAGSSYGFSVGHHDRRQPLVIDPSLAYSTYLGGFSFDQGSGIAVDSAGAAYVSGLTVSTDFPTTAGAFDTSYNNTGTFGEGDAFVTKLNPAGTGLAYSTYLGGSNIDQGFGIAVDSAGAAYLTGMTFSADFPTTAGAFDTSFNGTDQFPDAFVTKLNPAGTGLAYSTYLGGSLGDQGFGIAVDSAGAAYVTGGTNSTDFPTTAGAFDTSATGSFIGDAFVTKLNAAGSGLAYSTYLAGAGSSGIAVDSAGAAYVSGVANSTDFPTTAGAFDTSFNGGSFPGDAFVTKLNPAGTGLAYSTYLGGSLGDRGFGIAVDSAGAAYVTGGTNSTDFPTTAGAFDTSANGGGDAFVTKLNAAGSGLAYSTYLGGSSGDQGRGCQATVNGTTCGIAVDSAGAAYVSGDTNSTDFPTTAGAFDTSANGGGDAFVTKLNAAGSGLAYSTYLGGSMTDAGAGIAIDSTGAAYVTGFTGSTDFPTTAGAFDTSANGGTEAFVSKLLPLASTTNPTATAYTGDSSVQYSDPVSLSGTLTTQGGAPIAGKQLDFTLGTQTTSGAPTDAGGSVSAPPLQVLQIPGSVSSVATAFAGDATYAASSDNDPFAITKEDCTLAYSGDTLVAAPSNTTLAADLGEPDSSLGDLSGKSVTFTVTGVSSGTQTFSATTDAAGHASTSQPLAADVYGVSVAFAGDGYYKPCQTALDTLVTVQSAAAKVTGGGWISIGTGRSNFGFNAIPEAGGLFKGQFQLRPKNGKDKFHAGVVSTLTSSGNTATWSGTGNWNGTSGYTYTISVVDNGSSGSKKGDTINITIKSSGGTTVYTTGGSQALKGGNITVH